VFVVINSLFFYVVFFFQAEDGIRDATVTGVQTCALPIWTAAFVSSFVLNSMWGLARGFEVYDDETDVEKGANKSPWLLDRRGDRSEERRVGKECRCRRGR